MRELNCGDRIKIISPKSKYKNYYGTVAEINAGRNNNYVGVYIDNTRYQIRTVDNKHYSNTIRFARCNLEKIYNEGEMKMPKLTGFKRVAVIHIGHEDYYYALYDDNILKGDAVVVTGKAKGQLLEIKDIIASDSEEVSKINICSEVICKVDMANYYNRIKKREEAAKLRESMDKEITKMQETDKYEMYAGKNPKLAEMLARYKELLGQ